jgi:mono/diheme cytochrome c family protein
MHRKLQHGLVGAFLLLSLAGSAFGGELESSESSASYLKGRYIYERNCSVCHGKWGDGKGDMANGMFPKPRPFTSGLFKYKSTPSSFLPLNEDLMRSVRVGIAGTSMPAFAILSDREISFAVDYIKSFSSKWKKKENYAAPVQVPARPAWFEDKSAFEARAGAGRNLFQMACASCHGANGDGHGPASPALKDAWDEPCAPADLRRAAIRSGAELADIYRVLMTGIAGTPMPSFGEAMTPEQRWDIVAFIKDIRERQTSVP